MPLSEHLAQKLSELSEEYGSDGKRFVANGSVSEPVSSDRLRSVLSRGARLAGIGKVTPRMLRDTYAVRAVQAGAASDTIAELMGFTSVRQVVRRYMPPSMSDKWGLVNQMYDLV